MARRLDQDYDFVFDDIFEIKESLEKYIVSVEMGLKPDNFDLDTLKSWVKIISDIEEQNY